MLRAFAFLPALLAIAGCALVDTGDQVWYKEGVTARERDAAVAAAEIQAMQTQASATDQEKKGMVLTSMTAQGYRLLPRHAVPSMVPETERKVKPAP